VAGEPCAPPGVRAGLLRVALITQSTQRGPWGAGKSRGTPDAPATPGLCSESCVQRRGLLSLAGEPSLSWRWGGLALLSQTLLGTGAPGANLGSFSSWSCAVAAWLCPAWCSGWRMDPWAGREEGCGQLGVSAGLCARSCLGFWWSCSLQGVGDNGKVPVGCVTL